MTSFHCCGHYPLLVLQLLSTFGLSLNFWHVSALYYLFFQWFLLNFLLHRSSHYLWNMLDIKNKSFISYRWIGNTKHVRYKKSMNIHTGWQPKNKFLTSSYKKKIDSLFFTVKILTKLLNLIPTRKLHTQNTCASFLLHQNILALMLYICWPEVYQLSYEVNA